MPSSPVLGSAHAAAAQGAPPLRQPCNIAPVAPRLAVLARSIILVSKNSAPTNDCVFVDLGTTLPFTGEGVFECSEPDKLIVTNAQGVRYPLPLTIPGTVLSTGLRVRIGACAPSARTGGTVLRLLLRGGDKPFDNANPAFAALTCAEVTIDLCQFKPNPGGADAAPVLDKINGGRNLHLQTAHGWAGRALLIVRQVQPADFPGELILKGQNAKVQTFHYAHERAGPGQAPAPLPARFTKDQLISPHKLWVEGVVASDNLLDTGFIAEISPLPGLTGDRVNITVLSARFDVTTKPAGVDVLLPANEKFGAGCSLQIGNAQADGGWAALVMRTMPAAWGGQLVVGATDGQGPNPKLQLFRNNVALAPAIENQFVYPANGPGNPAPILVQGLRPSAVQGDAVVTLRASDAEGWADAVRMTLQDFFVKEIMFEGVVPISYARIPTAGSYLLAPAAEPAGTHVGPAPRPAVGGAHWKQANSNHEAAQYSWPAVFARQVGAQATHAVRAIFGLFPPMAGNVSVPVRAQSPGVNVLAQQVAFADGQSVPFRFQVTVPATVGCLNGMELTWLFGAAARRTRHTLFITDAMPRTGHFGQAVPYFWEIFEWSCTWAQGMFGENNVRDAIWAQFHPVRQVHGTQLVYWKPTVHRTMLAQDLVTAIRSQDLPEPRRNAASCIVFDRILINCLSAHGMLAAEIQLTAQPTGNRGGIQYNCESWNGTSIIGQGNAMAPRGWRSHWIAVVGTAPNTWVYYDASYGVMVPLALEPIHYLTARRVDSYESGAVREFNCTEAFFPFRAGTLPRHLTEPPFLLGAWLRNNW